MIATIYVYQSDKAFITVDNDISIGSRYWLNSDGTKAFSNTYPTPETYYHQNYRRAKQALSRYFRVKGEIPLITRSYKLARRFKVENHGQKSN